MSSFRFPKVKYLLPTPKMKRSSWCSCEETRDEFGGCVPTEDSKTCMACRKKISKDQISKWKQRMLKEYGRTSESDWEKKFDKKFDGWNAETFPAIKRFIKRLLKQKWEKEFEDKIYVTLEDGLQIKKNWYDLFRALGGNHLFKEKIPVKIKCKDGCIQIERIE